ncbi:hypothetical protein RDV78_05580 [Bacillota bacterium LX-D]|nr:hypothetical protein [Bacillota bacterium LX-D]
MTVEDLINKLQGFDQNLEVGISKLGYTPVTAVKMSVENLYENGEYVGDQEVIRIY